MGEELVDVRENGLAESRLVLEPCRGNAKEATGRSVSTPELEKLNNLTFALDEVKGEEPSAGEIAGAEDNSTVGVAIVAAFREERAYGVGLD